MNYRDIQIRFPYRTTRLRRFQRAGYVFALVVLMVFGIGFSKRCLESWIHFRASQVVDSMAARLGFEISFDALRIGSQAVEIHSLKLTRQDVELFTHSLSISLDVDLGFPSRIVVTGLNFDNLELKLNNSSKSDLKKLIAEIYAMSSHVVQDPLSSDLNSKQPSSWFSWSLGPQMLVNVGNTLVTYNSYPEVGLIRAQGSVSFGSKKMFSFATKKILVDGKLVHPDVEIIAKISHDNTEQIDLSYKHGSRNTSNRKEGSLDCELRDDRDGDSLRTRCRMSNFILPLEILSNALPKGVSLSNLKVTGDSRIDLIKQMKLLKVNFKGKFAGLKLFHPRLSLEEVGPINGEATTKFSWNMLTSDFIFEHLLFFPETTEKPSSVVSISNTSQIEIHRPFSSNRLITGDLSVKWSDQPCQQLLKTIPNGLLGELSAMKLNGNSSGNIAFHFREGMWDLKRERLELGCKIVSVPASIDARPLKDEFSLTRSFGSNEQIYLTIGRSQPGYVSLERVPNSLVNAVLLSEDAGFWGHNGVDIGSLEDAFELNSKKGFVTLGGSTITMQTAKNLFFPRNRALSRKLQEMIAANYLESQLGKRRILEIYLNLVEFGPGIYGVERAARHFFNVSTTQLSDKQSVYLASLLPAPTTRFASYCANSLKENHLAVVNRLLDKFRIYSKISEEAFRKAIDEPIKFDERQRWRCKDYFANRNSKPNQY